MNWGFRANPMTMCTPPPPPKTCYHKGQMFVIEELAGGGRVGSLFCLEKTDF